MPTYTTHYNLAKPLVNNATDQDLWGNELNDDLDLLDSIIFSIMPAGIVLPYAGLTEPSGFLFCYGQAISRATYADLFAVIGTTYGIGDGSTTFNLPDGRGRAPFGRDNMGGSAANRITNAVSGIDGATLGAVGGDQRMQSHNHAPAVGTGFVTVSASGVSQTPGAGSGAGSETVTGTTGAGSSQNMPPTLILNYIIKT